MTDAAASRRPLRVVLVDDQELVRLGLRALAERDGDIEIAAEAADGRAGLSLVRQLRPDVVLMDLRMPVMDGLAATEAIVADPALAGTRVVILTTFDEDDDVLHAIRVGAAGYLLKDIGPGELRSAIRTVAAGEALLSPAITTKLLRRMAQQTPSETDASLIAGLTERECEVLQRVGLGESNDEVGRALHISPATARTYVSRLLAKLGARDRSRLVVIAYESGLITPGST